jgi:hypothetical protein
MESSTHAPARLSTINPTNYVPVDHGINKVISIMEERKESQQHKESSAAAIPNLPVT